MGELVALDTALSEKYRYELRRDARLYALLCNLLAGGKKTWTEKDFLGEDPEGVPPESEEARQAIEAYRAKVASRRRQTTEHARQGSHQVTQF